MGLTFCTHQEEIEPTGERGIERGLCKVCGQVRQYNRLDFKAKPRVVQLGRIGGDIVIHSAKDTLMLSTQEQEEYDRARQDAKEQLRKDKAAPVTETALPDTKSGKDVTDPGENDTKTGGNETIDPDSVHKQDRIAICIYARETSLKEAEKKFGVPWRIIRAWNASYSQDGQPLHDPSKPKKHSRRTERAGPPEDVENQKVPRKCRACDSSFRLEGITWCSSVTCPSHYPREKRPPFRKGSPLPEPEEHGALKEAERILQESGIPPDINELKIIIDLVKSLNKMVTLLEEIDKSPKRGRLPELPEWNEKWKTPVKLAWIAYLKEIRLKELEVTYANEAVK